MMLFMETLGRRAAATIWPAIILSAVFASCAEASGAKNMAITTRKNILLVTAQIAGTGPLHFLIDTGVDPSVIDLETARRLNLPIDDSKVGEASGSGDDKGLAIMRSSIVGLIVNGEAYEPVDALAADLSGFSRALEIDLAGILGYSFLKHRVIRIDYRAKEIAIAESGKSLPPPSSGVTKRHRVPLRFNADQDPIPVFEIMVNGTPVQVSLDTGKSGGIEFYRPTTERLGLQERAAAGELAQRRGARGTRTVRTGELEAIRLGPFVVENASVSFSDKGTSKELREGNAGNLFLKNFVLTVDYVERSIIFEQ